MSRIRKDANYVKVGGYNISDLLFMRRSDLLPAIKNLELNDVDQIIAGRLLNEI